MDNKNSFDRIECLSLGLVLSFFIFHNIYMVFLGIGLAIYKINRKFINSILKLNKNINKNNIDNQRETYHKKLDKNNEDTLISLAEVIEESGFIPSIKEDDNINAA